VLAVVDGRHDQVPGHGVAADEFHDDVDVRVPDQGEGVVGHPDLATGEFPGPFQVAVRHGGDADGAAGAAGDFLRVAGEDGPGTAADGADPQQAYVDWFHIRFVHQLSVVSLQYAVTDIPSGCLRPPTT
jgi:hypothetical protein